MTVVSLFELAEEGKITFGVKNNLRACTTMDMYLCCLNNLN